MSIVVFRIEHHGLRSGEMIEIWDGSALVGALYPHERGVRLLSRYETAIVAAEHDGVGEISIGSGNRRQT